MKLIQSPTLLWLAILLLIIQTSCTKDSDLFAEYVVEDSITAEEGASQNSSSESSTSESNNEENSGEPDPQPENRNVEPGFYVTVNGSASNDGLTENSSWSLEHAFNTAGPGDIVYVKAGNYGATYITTSRGGSAGNPIKFIGYTSAPGDITANQGPTFTKNDWLSNGQDLPANVMPLLRASAPNDIPSSDEIAFRINHDYIEIHNFMITEHYAGIRLNGDNVVLDNIVGYRFGNWNSGSNCWQGSSVYGCDNNTGNGIWSPGSDRITNLTVKNSMIIDAGLASFFFTGDNNITLEWCEAYAWNPGNGSDYMFDFFGTSNSTITDCYAERGYTNPTSAHRSRLLILQAISDNNTVERFSGKNARIQLENARNNTFRDIAIEGNQNAANSGGIQIYGQSDDNIFVNVYMSGESIQFLGHEAGAPGFENPRNPVTSSGENNYFINVVVENLPNFGGNAVVSFHRLRNFGSNTITAGTNYIIGGTFNNVARIINANRPGTINFYNCSFSNIDSEEDGYYSNWPNHTNNYQARYTNCNFYNMNGFSFPSATGAVLTNPTTGNPMFANAASGDYSLRAGSSLINKGMDASTVIPEAIFDMVGNSRGSNGVYEIGAYEY